MLVKEPAEVGDGQAGQTLVLEQTGAIETPVRAPGLPGARHGCCNRNDVFPLRRTPMTANALPGIAGKPHVPARQVPGRARQRLVELGTQDLSGYCHYKSDNISKLVTA